MMINDNIDNINDNVWYNDTDNHEVLQNVHI